MVNIVFAYIHSSRERVSVIEPFKFVWVDNTNQWQQSRCCIRRPFVLMLSVWYSILDSMNEREKILYSHYKPNSLRCSLYNMNESYTCIDLCSPDTFGTMKFYLARHTLLIINTNSCQTYTSLYDYKSSKQHTYFSPFFLEHELTRVYLRKYCKTTYSGLTIFSWAWTNFPFITFIQSDILVFRKTR